MEVWWNGELKFREKRERIGMNLEREEMGNREGNGVGGYWVGKDGVEDGGGGKRVLEIEI